VEKPLTEQSEDVEGRICVYSLSEVIRAMMQDTEVWFEITKVVDRSEFYNGRAQSHDWEIQGVQDDHQIGKERPGVVC
jgi:hypothetical protein